MNAKWQNDRQEVQDVINGIALKCVDCSCWSKDEVENCFDNDCPIYPWRLDGTISRSKLAILQNLRKNPSKTLSKVEGFKESEK